MAAQGHATTQTKFTYAWGLVKSPKKIEQEEGISLLRCSYMLFLDFSALSRRFFLAVYQEDPSRRRECLYYLALGHYKMGHYEEARRFNGNLFFLSVF